MEQRPERGVSNRNRLLSTVFTVLLSMVSVEASSLLVTSSIHRSCWRSSRDYRAPIVNKRLGPRNPKSGISVR